MKLPTFKYHPDPVATGSVVASDDACECCGKAQGFIYDGPIYCKDEVTSICPGASPTARPQPSSTAK